MGRGWPHTQAQGLGFVIYCYCQQLHNCSQLSKCFNNHCPSIPSSSNPMRHYYSHEALEAQRLEPHTVVGGQGAHVCSTRVFLYSPCQS